MTVVGDKMYAVGGDSEYGEQDSVESYTEGLGWQLEERMRLPQARSHHCSVAIDDRHLVVVGGQQNGENDGRNERE